MGESCVHLLSSRRSRARVECAVVLCSFILSCFFSRTTHTPPPALLAILHHTHNSPEKERTGGDVSFFLRGVERLTSLSPISNKGILADEQKKGTYLLSSLFGCRFF